MCHSVWCDRKPALPKAINCTFYPEYRIYFYVLNIILANTINTVYEWHLSVHSFGFMVLNFYLGFSPYFIKIYLYTVVFQWLLMLHSAVIVWWLFLLLWRSLIWMTSRCIYSIMQIFSKKDTVSTDHPVPFWKHCFCDRFKTDYLFYFFNWWHLMRVYLVKFRGTALKLFLLTEHV